jgi:hypothetical protein
VAIVGNKIHDHSAVLDLRIDNYLIQCIDNTDRNARALEQRNQVGRAAPQEGLFQ